MKQDDYKTSSSFDIFFVSFQGNLNSNIEHTYDQLLPYSGLKKFCTSGCSLAKKYGRGYFIICISC